MVVVIDEEMVKYKNFEKSFYDDSFFKEFVDYLEEYHEIDLVNSIVSYEKEGRKYSYQDSRLLIDNICICCNPYQSSIKRVLEDILEQLEIEEDVVVM